MSYGKRGEGATGDGRDPGSRTPVADPWRDSSLYRSLIEGCPDAVIVSDRDGRIRLWNRGAVRIFEYEEDEAVGASLDIIIPGAQRERHWRGYREVMASGTTRYGESLLRVPAVRRDGARISVEFSVALLCDDSGSVLGIAAFLRDVTAAWNETRETRKRLRALEGELRGKGERDE